ncbi:MAG TPA: mechanosensitive ion channel family protein, partial [Terriglobales bacterium]|nr:mechanosensitive ion channel family protein [Terriglobales bacterium]
GLLKCAESHDFETAARYLQPTPGQDTNLVERGKELQALHSRFKGNIALLSDDPNGTVQAGLPPGQVRAGGLTVGGTTTDIILVRVDDPASGKIWLLSRETVAKIPALYAQMKSEGQTVGERILPAALITHQLLGMSLAQWLEWVLSIPISWSLARLLELLLGAPRRIWCKLQKLPFKSVWRTPIGMPLRCIIAIVLHSLLVYLLKPPLLYRVYYFRFMAALLAGCLVWLVSRLADQGFDHVVNRARRQSSGGESILILMQRLTRVVLLIVALVGALALFGFDVKTALAGLGIGGLAIALGAQKTLENVLGGIALLMDKSLYVGNFCKIGDQLGSVEDIGLRSVKVRTLDQTLLVVPNGALAQMRFENFASRRKWLINQHFLLRIETEVEQLRFVLDRVQGMLDQHPAIETGTSRIRVANFAGAAFELELWAYGEAADAALFTAIRQHVILNIAEIVKAAGTRFAAPTRLTYLSTDASADAEKLDGVVRRVTEPQSTPAGHE